MVLKKTNKKEREILVGMNFLLKRNDASQNHTTGEVRLNLNCFFTQSLKMQMFLIDNSWACEGSMLNNDTNWINETNIDRNRCYFVYLKRLRYFFVNKTNKA